MTYNPIDAIGHEQLTVSTTAVGLTPPTGLRPRHALISIQTNAIRWRADGTDPTASIGIPKAAATEIDLTDPMGDYAGFLSKAKFIRSGGADATLDIQYFS